MNSRDDPFEPKRIDEHIEWLAQRDQEGAQEHDQSSRLVQRLQDYYVRKKQEETLEQAWKHIAQKYEDSILASPGEERVPDEQSKLERSGQYSMHEQTTKILSIRRVLPPWRTLVAVAVLALVIGSTAVILSQAAAQRNTAPGTGSGGGNYSICPPTPTAQPTATVLPTAQPTAVPCVPAIATPTVTSRSGSTPVPTAVPTILPTPVPTILPTPVPTTPPTPVPTILPTPVPTILPTPVPTK